MKTILFSLLLAIAPAHKFYVSVSEMQYNEESKTLEIATKIFTDDLETCIDGLNIGETPTSENEVLIARYLLTEIEIRNNRKFVGMKFLGYEINDDVVWCYIESDEIADLSSVEVSFTFLMDELNKQTNIIHFEKDGMTKTVFLNEGNKRDQIDW